MNHDAKVQTNESAYKCTKKINDKFNLKPPAGFKTKEKKIVCA